MTYDQTQELRGAPHIHTSQGPAKWLMFAEGQLLSHSLRVIVPNSVFSLPPAHLFTSSLHSVFLHFIFSWWFLVSFGACMEVDGSVEVSQLTDTKHHETAQVTYHIQDSQNLTIRNPSYCFG